MRGLRLALCSACIVGATSVVSAEGIENFLSQNYNDLFDLQLQKSQKDADFDKLSWIAPVTLSFERSWSNQVPGSSSAFNRYSIGINQPIFKSGGIYYAIEYAKSNLALSTASVLKQRLSLKANAVVLALKIKETKLAIKKLQLQIKNRDIEIKSVQELYGAGLTDGVTLDNSLVKKEETKLALLELESSLETLYAEFRKISDKDPKSIRVPYIKIPSKEEYLSRNIDLDIADAKTHLSKKLYKLKRSKYLPTISVGARYTKLSKAQPGLKDAFTNYSLQVTMPLSINVGNDLERSKLSSMIAKVEAKNAKRAASSEYDLVLKKLAIINKRIKVAQKEARVYSRLLKSTKDLFSAGQKSKQDVVLLENSLKIQRINVAIYKIERELAKIELFKKVR